MDCIPDPARLARLLRAPGSQSLKEWCFSLLLQFSS
jgi:hypothetical protein